MKSTNEIHSDLLAMADEEYAQFNRKLMPNIARDAIVGVRTPQLRTYAKQLFKNQCIDDFLNNVPHSLFEENQLHAFLLSELRDFDLCMNHLNTFLPYVDNWATCDQLLPRCFAKNKLQLYSAIEQWIKSEHEYTVRFGIGTLMRHFLDADFDPKHLDIVASICRNEYYIKMMQAWYFATALAKQYDATITYLVNEKLSIWVNNKTIQKAIESYRVSNDHKAYLRTLKRKE